MKPEIRCQKRIRNRRSSVCFDSGRGVNAGYVLVITVLLGATIFLTAEIQEKKGFDLLVQKVEAILEPLQLYRISDWIPFENWFLKKHSNTITTSFLTHYTQLDEHYFEALNNQVVAVESGIVIYTDQQESGYLMMIKQDNGLIATYGTMSEVHAKVDDRVLKGEILGLTQNAVYLDFSENGTAMSFYDAIAY